MQLSVKKTILWVFIFSVAMGFFENAVVIYLREIIYPGGFSFPLKPISNHLMITELLREASTLIMIFSIGVIAGRTLTERFAYFLFSFAIWDIFYYVFLKLLLDWPESLMTWDILFLIPITWTGPVITPVIVSFTMILFAMVIIYHTTKNLEKNKTVIFLNIREWVVIVFGAFLVFLSFIWDYTRFLLQHFTLGEMFSGDNQEAIKEITNTYIPVSFNWWIFIAGEVVLLIGIYMFHRRIARK
jgi:hypothetical protein